MGLFKGIVKALITCTAPTSTISDVKYLTLDEMNGKFATLPKYKVIQLSGNLSEDLQDNLYSCKIGEEVDVSEDVEGKIYVDGMNCGEIGRCPKSTLKLIQNNFEAYVYNLHKNEKGKFVVSIVIFEVNDSSDEDEDND